VTPVTQFYGMSKNTVDPVIDVRTWQLTISMDGRPVRRFSYSDLLAMRNRELRFVTLRCISNTLKSDLMGTAEWAGIHLSQLIDPKSIPGEMIEAAFIGVEGHDDSMSIDYAFSPETLLAFGMNGKTLSRTHGFPVRLLAPRYYGCRNVKWIGEIRFVSTPYYGTWQRLGYTRDPAIHTASHIDRMKRVDGRLRFGGVSFAGSRGIRAVRVRANRGAWVEAHLENPLSSYTWTRWIAELPAAAGDTLEANAQDGEGAWQELAAAGPFPTGPMGPTIVTVRV
jgi:DMSO/TMAO reductase YedYZ molybdopterin-dependent catalytic subunit